MNLQRIFMVLILAFLTMALIACGGSKDETSGAGEADNVSENTELKIAMESIPPTLDPHITGSFMTMEIARPVFEPLVALDSQYEPQPMLADSWDISDDQQTYTFHLREGIKFHNGEEMTAADVVASMTRWMEANSTAERILGTTTFEEVDEYTVEMNLEDPSFVALTMLATPSQFAGIMPAEVVENADADSVNEYIGTGPYKVSDYVSDQYLRVEKFDDYQSRDEEADALAGKKEAKVDEILFEFISDSSTRVSSLMTGEYHIGKNLPYDNYDQLDAEENVEVYAEEAGTDYIVLNKKERLFSDKTARQALLVGLDLEALALGTYSDDRFYDLNHSISIEDQVNWYNDAGKEKYNQNDPEKAKELLDEAGYNGEEITIIASNIESHQNTAIGLQQQLEGFGMNVNLETYEFATVLEYREDPANWDIFIVDLATEPMPINQLYFNPTWAGWTDSPEISEIIESIKTAADQEEATALAYDLQEEFYEYVPVIKPSNRKMFNATTSDVEGYEFFNIGTIPWNISLE